VIAVTFHFPPSELWEMDSTEFLFWCKQARWVNERER